MPKSFELHRLPPQKCPRLHSLLIKLLPHPPGHNLSCFCRPTIPAELTGSSRSQHPRLKRLHDPLLCLACPKLSLHGRLIDYPFSDNAAGCNCKFLDLVSLGRIFIGLDFMFACGLDTGVCRGKNEMILMSRKTHLKAPTRE